MFRHLHNEEPSFEGDVARPLPSKTAISCSLPSFAKGDRKRNLFHSGDERFVPLFISIHHNEKCIENDWRNNFEVTYRHRSKNGGSRRREREKRRLRHDAVYGQHRIMRQSHLSNTYTPPRLENAVYEMIRMENIKNALRLQGVIYMENRWRVRHNGIWNAASIGTRTAQAYADIGRYRQRMQNRECEKCSINTYI